MTTASKDDLALLPGFGPLKVVYCYFKSINFVRFAKSLWKAECKGIIIGNLIYIYEKNKLSQKKCKHDFLYSFL